MEISVTSNKATIQGNIKSISDFQEIKIAIDVLTSKYDVIVINIKDSLSITSSVIGYLNKLILKDNINISMKIGNSQLLELIDDLNLKSVFKATKA
jgi:3-deoxy-D-manno-octulosonate 8-phosphate phosphatase KdsC-like HAD superfamily phosphatase